VFTIGLVLPALALGQAIEAIHHDTSPPLSEMAGNVAPVVAGENREIPIGVKPDMGGRDPNNAAPDGGLQSPSYQLAPTPPPILSVSGLSEQDNLDTIGAAIVPPDTNGDIGLDVSGNRIYVQYINLVWGVFDVTGNLIHGPFAGNSFWTGFGGFCETNNNGDPIVLYDDQAGRWFFSQFSVNQGIQCVAISTTSDPLGPYHRYAFLVTPGGANDYPKLGVWDDGTTGSTGQSAYTFTLRDFGGAGGPFSVSAGVMERDAMLVGAAAQAVKFNNPCVANECIEGQLPPHLAGPTPPAGTCPTFWTAVDSAFDDSPHNNDGYRNHTLCVDWSDIGSSTYTEGPFVVAGSNFDRHLAGAAVTPVNSGDKLDALQFFTMYRAQYRWFGSNARVVLNTTVDAGADRAGIRWAETRSADGQSNWFLQQDGTYAGDSDDGIERWMGSIAQDQDGNIALGYSATSDSLFPSVRYATRTAGDPLGTMPGGEASCHEGTGAQVASAGRWGDYSSMSVDPTDDCTFWYTQEYYQTTGSFDFNTRICSFRFPDCGGPCVPTETPESTCVDGLDNDCDGDYDCTDSDCAADEACVCVPVTEICDDGIDNDCDGLIDCVDPDCNSDPACPIPPENDLCSDAIPLECNETVLGSTDLATFDGADFCGTSNTAPGVWYSVAHSGIITASTCNQADYDTKLSVYSGACGALGCIGGIDDTPGCAGFTSELTWTGDGSDNLLLVHGFASATGNFDLTITCEEPAENDLCEYPGGPLEAGDIESGTTTTATLDEPPDIDCGTSVTAPGTWYDVIGTGNTMTASTCNDGDPSTGGTNYDTKISVYCADCETKECIGGVDDTAGCGGFSTKFDWPTNEGTTYKVLVHGFGSATGDFDLAILDDGTPVPPGAANDCDGIDAAFDFCPGTVIPEAVPTSGNLKKNNSALTGIDPFGVFETAPPNPQGVVYTLEDTAGCSCDQIIDFLGLGKGHMKFGCSFSVMDQMLAFLEENSCGDCVTANGTPGCENGECEAAVCAIDPFCCDVAWDSICAGEALDICSPDICLATPGALEAELTPIPGGRAHVPEPVSKDPAYKPKEE
jgi:hypothetical protein